MTATLARVPRAVFRQELKQDSDSTAVLGRERFQRDGATLTKARTHHQLGEDPGAGWVGEEGQTKASQIQRNRE